MMALNEAAGPEFQLSHIHHNYPPSLGFLNFKFPAPPVQETHMLPHHSCTGIPARLQVLLYLPRMEYVRKWMAKWQHCIDSPLKTRP